MDNCGLEEDSVSELQLATQFGKSDLGVVKMTERFAVWKQKLGHFFDHVPAVGQKLDVWILIQQ
jgi:hypothetical protein